MSNDSLENMSVVSHVLLPVSSNLREHHRVLNLNAVKHDQTVSTIKAHKVRMDSFEEAFDELKEYVEEVRDSLSEIREFRSILEQNQKAMSDLTGIVTTHSTQMAEKKGGFELKKAIVIGIFSVLTLVVTTLGGVYAVGGKADAPKYVPPTHAQALDTERKYQEMTTDSDGEKVNLSH